MKYWCVLLSLVLLWSCKSEPKKTWEFKIQDHLEETKPIQAPIPSLEDSTFQIAFDGNLIDVIVDMPNEPFIGTIIALPGWNFPNTGWCDSTQLCMKASRKGYALVLPQMGKSIYCDTIYPETRSSWRKYPTRAWFKNVLIPELQKHNLLDTLQNNYVLGLSTGARGAALIALDCPELFSACGLLSGDYDQTQFPSDNLYRGYYGPLNNFPNRWQDEDNVITSIDQFIVPAYLAHGGDDNIVPETHSKTLYKELQVRSKECQYEMIPDAKHTYSFWDSQVDAMLNYFSEHKKNQ